MGSGINAVRSARRRAYFGHFATDNDDTNANRDIFDVVPVRLSIHYPIHVSNFSNHSFFHFSIHLSHHFLPNDVSAPFSHHRREAE